MAIFVRFSLDKVNDLMIEQDFIDKETHKLLYEFHGILHVISVQYKISKI
jgi:hypothetical protein